MRGIFALLLLLRPLDCKHFLLEAEAGEDQVEGSDYRFPRYSNFWPQGESESSCWAQLRLGSDYYSSFISVGNKSRQFRSRRSGAKQEFEEGSRLPMMCLVVFSSLIIWYVLIDKKEPNLPLDIIWLVSNEVYWNTKLYFYII